MSRLLQARYRMWADVYPELRERDRSGQVTRTWDYDHPIDTISCSARGILGGGIRVVGSTQTWDEDYEDVEWVKLRTASEILFLDEEILKSHQIGNIRRKDGRLLWKDSKGEPLIFNISGIQPVLDAFDRISEVEVLLKGVTGD